MFDAPYLALFGTAFLAATLFPAQSELVLAYLLQSRPEEWPWLLAVATIGNVIGSSVNWALGRWIEHFRDRRWFPVSRKSLDRAEAWYSRWGKWSLLLSWVPFAGDALTLIAGMLRAPFPTFLLLVSLAKFARYAAIVLIVFGAGSI